MPKSINDWLAEGESLYDAALSEYHDLEAQLSDLERRLTDKVLEVNRIAAVVHKPTLAARAAAPGAPANGMPPVVTGTVVDGVANGHVAGIGPGAVPASPRTIAQALQGKGLGR